MNNTLLYTFAAEQTRHWRFGSLDLWVHRQQRSWLFAAASVPPTGVPTASDELFASGPDELDKPEEVEWKRVVPRTMEATVHFSPVMADRPVVVRAQFPLTVNPRAATTVYADLPVWIRVSSGASTTTTGQDSASCGVAAGEFLYESPVKTLSNTWYGGPLTGKLCYTLDTTLHYDPELIRRGDIVAGCRLTITNQTRRPFSVGKVAVFANLLSVYRIGEGIASPLPAGYWTEDARAILIGDEELAVGVGDKPPAPGARLVGPARERTSENILKKSLILLKKISNY